MTASRSNQKEMTAVLEQINFHLKSNDLPQLEKTINEGDIAAILSNETLGIARGMRNSQLVLLLASLAVDTGVDVATAEHWRDIYLSIKEKRLVGKTATLPAKNSLRGVIELILGSTDNEKVDFNKGPGSEQDVVDAFELACDFFCWKVAGEILNSRTQGKKHLKTCLAMAKSMITRQLFLKTPAAHQHIASFIEKIIQTGGALYSPEIRRTLQTIAAASHQFADNPSEALRNYQGLDPDKRDFVICSEIAKSHCKLGDFEKSIAYLDRSIDLLIQSKSGQAGARPLPLILQNPTEAKYTVGRATTALQDLANLATLLGQKLFLVSGTLLGYARERNLMAHDKDVDLGLIGHKGLPGLVKLGLESKLFYISPEYLKGKDTVQVPFIHIPTGIWIDLFVYSEQDGKLVTGVDFQFGYRQTFEFTPFDLVPIDFLGVALHAPADIDLNLRENFGDWRQPDPSYISHLESPSTMDKGGWVHLLTARIWIIKAIQDGNLSRLQKAIACLREYPDNPGAATPAWLAQVSHYLAQALASNRRSATEPPHSAPEPLTELASH